MLFHCSLQAAVVAFPATRELYRRLHRPFHQPLSGSQTADGRESGACAGPCLDAEAQARVLALCENFNHCVLDMDAFVTQLLAVVGRDALVRSCDIDAAPPVRASAAAPRFFCRRGLSSVAQLLPTLPIPSWPQHQLDSAHAWAMLGFHAWEV